MRNWLSLMFVASALGVGAFGALAQPAAAAGLSPPVADCEVHLGLTRTYPIPELRSALASIPADIQEYSVCYGIIQQALNKAISTQRLHADGAGGGGGSFLPTWLIVVLAVLILSGGASSAYAWRRRAEA